LQPCSAGSAGDDASAAGDGQTALLGSPRHEPRPGCDQRAYSRTTVSAATAANSSAPDTIRPTGPCSSTRSVTCALRIGARLMAAVSCAFMSCA
jgi:hypothetical protein